MAPKLPEDQVANLVAAHLRDGFGLKDPSIAEFSATQQHARELQVIACRRVKPTAAAEKSNWFERLAWRLQEATILLAVMDCYDTRLFLCRDIEKCVCHAERLKNMLTKVFLQSLAADFLDQLAEPRHLPVEGATPMSGGRPRRSSLPTAV